MKKGFISYSHKDDAMCQELRKQLEPLAMAGLIEFWADYAVEPGDPWKEEILAALYAAEVALFLISPEVWWSEFIRNVELPVACERASKGELVIIPVVLRPCLWKVIPSICLPRLQAVPKAGRPVIDFNPIDFGYFDAAQRIADRISGKSGRFGGTGRA